MNGIEMINLIRARGSMPSDRPSAGDWADVLATFPLFSGVRKRQLRKLARQATFAEFAPGERVVENGDSAGSIYMVLGGEAKALQKPAARALRTGDYFGELALLDAAPRSAAVIATKQLHVMRLPSQPVAQLAQRHAAVSVTMLKNLSTQLRRLEAEVASAG
jgi:CRP/FNR family transcriptional regulator, cyclic AMP receptor protein